MECRKSSIPHHIIAFYSSLSLRLPPSHIRCITVSSSQFSPFHFVCLFLSACLAMASITHSVSLYCSPLVLSPSICDSPRVFVDWIRPGSQKAENGYSIKLSVGLSPFLMQLESNSHTLTDRQAWVSMDANTREKGPSNQ